MDSPEGIKNAPSNQTDITHERVCSDSFLSVLSRGMRVERGRDGERREKAGREEPDEGEREAARLGSFHRSGSLGRHSWQQSQKPGRTGALPASFTQKKRAGVRPTTTQMRFSEQSRHAALLPSR